MNLRVALIVLFPFITTPLAARAKLDILFLNNGDRITCEVKRLDHGILYAGIDYVDGTITIDWAKVDRIESPQPFTVETVSGEIYAGTLRTLSKPGDRPRKIGIVEDVSKQEASVDHENVVTAEQYGTSIWRRLHGKLTGGLITNKSDVATQYNFSTELSYLKSRSKAQLNYSSSLSNSSSAPTSTRNQLDLKGERLMRWNNWFYEGGLGLLQSTEQGLKLQSLLNFGVGRYIKNTNHTKFSLAVSGASYNAKYVDGSSQQAGVAVITSELRIFKFSKRTLVITPVLIPFLSEPGRVRFNLNATYDVQMIRNLWWNTTLYGNFDNRAPVGLAGSDYGLTMGVSYSFN